MRNQLIWGNLGDDISTKLALERINTLRKWNSFWSSFIILDQILQSVDQRELDLAQNCQKEIVEICKTKSEKKALKYVAISLVPILLHYLSSSEIKKQKLVYHAIQEFPKSIKTPLSLIQAMIKHLEGRESIKINAIESLGKCADKGWDISQAIPRLHEVFENDTESNRLIYLASQTISNFYRKTKKEERLIIQKQTQDNLKSLWSIEISHRRMMAGDDRELNWKTNIGWHICGICRSNELKLIYHYSDVGNAWKYYRYEYKCSKCEKYSLFSYDD